jgi:hypothetical protein
VDVDSVARVSYGVYEGGASALFVDTRASLLLIA